jgi:hypothetical protein
MRNPVRNQKPKRQSIRFEFGVLSISLMPTVPSGARDHGPVAGRRGRVRLWGMLGGGSLLALAPLGAANAALGEYTGSVIRDHDALRGTLVVLPMQGYEVHQIDGASGAIVRVVNDTHGRRVAVTWSGTSRILKSYSVGTLAGVAGPWIGF